MKRALTTLLLASGTLAAQPPRAEPVDEVLAQDPGEAFFQRVKNLRDEADRAADQENKMMLFGRVATLFDQYLRQYPNHPKAEAAWYYLGEAYYHTGQAENGRACFLRLKNRYGEGIWAAAAAYWLAYEHYNKSEYAFAAPLFELYAKNAGKETDRPRGYFFAADCYRLLGRDREALNAYKAVLDSPSGFSLAPKAKFYTAQILLKTGKAQEALPLFQEVADGTGNPAELRGDAALGASNAAAKTGQHDLAGKYLLFILNTPGLEAFRADAQIVLMKQAFDRKEYKEVIAIYQRNLVKAEGEKEAARLMIAARAYQELGRPLDAQPLFRQIEQLVPPENELAFDAAYYRLHTFFQIEGRHVPDQVDAFLQIYRKTRPPDDQRIHTALMIKAETLYSANDNLGAAKVFSEINADALAEKNRPGLLYKRGWCLADTGDLQGAIRSLSEFIAKYPKDQRFPEALAKRAKCYAEAGETSKAIADFDQLTSEGMPADVTNMGWLESARMRRKENNIQDMMIRYKALLGRPDVPEKFISEANFYTGWGLVKTNLPNDAVPFLEKARSLDSKTYGKHAGLLLCIVYGGLQDAQKLSAEINLAIEGGYADEIPDQTVQWTGMQAYNGGDYKSAARFLDLISNAEDPRATPSQVWRYLGKARFESGDAAAALVAADNLLAVETGDWKADALVDKGRALLALDRAEQARLAANEASDLRPQGRTSTLLGLLNGDLFTHEKNLERAGAEYIKVVQFAADPELKALALHKLAANWDQRGDKAEAEKYRGQLTKEFPNWKAP